MDLTRLGIQTDVSYYTLEYLFWKLENFKKKNVKLSGENVHIIQI